MIKIEIKERTQKEFLNIMLNNLKNTEDKTPNSFSYDALSSTSIVFRYFQDIVLELFKKFDVMNLEGEELDTRALQIAGLTRKKPTFASGKVRVTGEVGSVIPKDTIFLADDIEYISNKEYVIGQDGSVDVYVTCTTPGSMGNIIAGGINDMKKKIIGINNITNLEEFHNGYDLEPDGDLIERYLDVLTNPPKAGNPAHYKLWATEVDGVWDAKVFRTWQGGGTVKVVVIGLNRKAVGLELIEKVKKHIFEQAPIRYEDLTVESATTKKVKVNVKIKITKNSNLINIKENIKNRIDKYFYDISFKENIISYARLGAEILKVEGVEDYDELKINGNIGNLAMTETEIPELESLEVVSNE